jgi:hypothetical protein
MPHAKWHFFVAQQRAPVGPARALALLVDGVEEDVLDRRHCRQERANVGQLLGRGVSEHAVLAERRERGRHPDSGAFVAGGFGEKAAVERAAQALDIAWVDDVRHRVEPVRVQRLHQAGLDQRVGKAALERARLVERERA